jgi:hypothetical protein
MDIYKISVALAMSSNHNAVLGALASQLLHVHANVNNLTAGFGRLKTSIGSAFAIGTGAVSASGSTRPASAGLFACMGMSVGWRINLQIHQ